MADLRLGALVKVHLHGSRGSEGQGIVMNISLTLQTVSCTCGPTAGNA